MSVHSPKCQGGAPDVRRVTAARFLCVTGCYSDHEEPNLNWPDWLCWAFEVFTFARCGSRNRVLFHTAAETMPIFVRPIVAPQVVCACGSSHRAGFFTKAVGLCNYKLASALIRSQPVKAGVAREKLHLTTSEAAGKSNDDGK